MNVLVPYFSSFGELVHLKRTKEELESFSVILIPHLCLQCIPTKTMRKDLQICSVESGSYFWPFLLYFFYFLFLCEAIVIAS